MEKSEDIRVGPQAVWKKIHKSYTDKFDFEKHYLAEAHLAQCRAVRPLFFSMSERSQDAINVHIWDAVFFDCFEEGFIKPSRYETIYCVCLCDQTGKRGVKPLMPLATQIADQIYH